MVIVLTLLMGAATPAIIHAQEIWLPNESNRSQYLLDEQSLLDQDLYVIADTITIAGQLNANAYLIARDISITGTINGHVHAISGQIFSSGQVQSMTAVAGQTRITGKIADSATIITGQANLTNQAKISNLSIITGMLNTQAQLDNDPAIIAGKAMSTSRISDNLTLITNELIYGHGATISGSLRTNLNQTQLNTANVPEFLPTQTISFSQNEHKATSTIQALKNTASLLGAALSIGSIVIGFIAIYTIPNLLYRNVLMFEESPLQSFAIGLLVTSGLPITTLLLGLTGIGIPIAAIIVAASITMIIVSKIVVSYWIGARLLNRLKRQASKHLTYTIGAALYLAITNITIIGQIIIVVSTVAASGSVILSMLHTYRSARKLKII